MNEDYIKGIKFLLQKAKEQKINIRKAQWIPNVSKILSEHNACYKFWYNVWQQNRLHKILLCDTWFDVMYDHYRFLFRWDATREGHSFWSSMLTEVLGITLKRPLRD